MKRTRPLATPARLPVRQLDRPSSLSSHDHHPLSMYRLRPAHSFSQNADQQADEDLQRALRLSIKTTVAHEDPPPPSSPSPLPSSSTSSAHAPFAISSSLSASTSIRQNLSYEELALQEDRDLAFALAASLALASDPDPYSPATTATVGPNSPRPAWADAVDDDHEGPNSPWTRGSFGTPPVVPDIRTLTQD